MKYLYSNATYPRNPGLLRAIDSAADRLHRKLAALIISEIGLSDYNQRYLRDKLVHPIGVLQLYGYLLAWALGDCEKPLSEVTVVDYGAGSGVLTMLTKELGVGKVIYNDIYDVSCGDAEKISKRMDCEIADFVCGDIDALVAHQAGQSTPIDAIVSYDVIEHIYDIDSFFRKLPELATAPLRITLGSGANTRNPAIRKRLVKGHYDAEFVDHEKKWGHKERDAVRGFLSIRREIITNYDSNLKAEDLLLLAEGTRGLMISDIERAVDEFQERGSISYLPDHPTNTCDPYTGNWAEHLMRTENLERTLGEVGFEARILNGFWAHSPKQPNRFIKNMLNLGVRALGANGLMLAPYYVVHGDYRTS